MATLQPMGNNVIFTFLDDTRTSDGKFSERTTGSVIVATPQRATQTGVPRWGKVLFTGPDVHDVEPGQYVLIEAGKWTVGTEFDGEKIWMTDDTAIYAVTTDIKETYNF